ncbi:hypothetical protein [Actinocatenispora rupis]|nr:hypothetical protein [Actinocatenispora rupis]
MSDAYTVYWPQERWRQAVAVGPSPLAVLFGGPHSSEPSFRRAAVRTGDVLYPIGVCDQALYVFGRMRVRQIRVVGTDDDGPLLEYFAQFRAWRFLAPTCTDEVVLGEEGTGIVLDRAVPAEVLKRLTYRPRRGPRPVKHVSEDGRLVHPISVQGIYRLSEASAADLDAVLTGPPGTPITRRPSRHIETPSNMDTLF